MHRRLLFRHGFLRVQLDHTRRHEMKLQLELSRVRHKKCSVALMWRQRNDKPLPKSKGLSFQAASAASLQPCEGARRARHAHKGVLVA